jgi:hypothetical protein
MPVVYQRLTDRVLATGVTPSDLIHIVIPSDLSQDPDGSSYKATIQQVFDSYDDIFVTGGTYSNGTTTFINTSGGTFTVTGFTQQFTGGSSNCITDFYVSNIHSCSPLNINPLDEGNVYFGSQSGVTLNLNGSFSRVGINNDSPSATLDIVGKLGSNRLLVQTQGLGSTANSNNFSLYNTTATSGNYFGFNRYGGTISSPSDFGDGESPLISKFVGYVYKDSALNPSTQITMGAKDLATSVYNGYISFATTSGNSLNERMIIDYNGNVGINIDSPSEKLEVSGKTKTTNFQMTSGATNNYVLTSDSLGNGYWLPLSSRGLFSQTGDSTPISATTSELSLIGNGVGSLSVPANGFSIGDSFRLIIGGHISSRNGDTLTINVKTNSTLLGTTGAITMPNITSKHFNFQIDFTIRNIGGAGTASIVSLGRFTYTKNASNAYEGSDFSDIENTTFNTTIVNNLNITAQFNTTNPDNQIYSELLTLSKTY